MNYSNICKYAMALFSKLFPRNNHLWITGKSSDWEYENNPPQFFDNSKYFYLFLHYKTNEKVYWLSDSDEEYNFLKGESLPVAKLRSLKGKYLTLRAKYSFHHYGPDQIDRILQYGSTQMDFWHGTPLKKIRYDVAPKVEVRPNPIAAFLMKGGREYISSTSEYLSENVLRGAFQAEKWQMVNCGYPRMDIMKYDVDALKEFCQKYSKTLMPYIGAAEGKKVFLYMPTYREDDFEYFQKANIDYEKLNRKLRETNGVFFLKLHPLTKDVNVDGYENIIQISNDTDIYPFLKFVDYLITDYSSIYFDFLPLDREIIFIPYDLKDYIKSRELYFDYSEVTPGKKYECFDQFIDALEKVEELDYSEERKKIRDLFIENYHYDACVKTYHFLKGKE